MIAPSGDMVDIPDENADTAQDAGFRVMTDPEMSNLFNRYAMAERLFEIEWKKKHRPLKRRLRFLRG